MTTLCAGWWWVDWVDVLGKVNRRVVFVAERDGLLFTRWEELEHGFSGRLNLTGRYRDDEDADRITWLERIPTAEELRDLRSVATVDPVVLRRELEATIQRVLDAG